MDNKQRALYLLVYALNQTRAGKDVGLILLSEDGNTAHIFDERGDIIKDVNVECDSALAAIIDVCKALM